ncbi:hypothetical protein [Natronoarchaeum rubrum]|uniref:hypothetical protein n=1 Tax=Natronoarchaeum rubrum TaxID=755311 RepID=UPI0021126197|nr:hypothetical protein [Natronoarchaeum rubrum]
MTRLTWIGAICTLLAAATLVGATGGFGAASADRELIVDVADGDSADLGVDVRATSKYGCGAAVTVTNRFPATIESVTVEGSHHRLNDGFPHESATIDGLAPGEAETVTISLDKFAGAAEVTIDADGEDVSVELVRDVDASGASPCEKPGKGGKRNRGPGHGA